jgi:hypothetical protein
LIQILGDVWLKWLQFWIWLSLWKQYFKCCWQGNDPCLGCGVVLNILKCIANPEGHIVCLTNSLELRCFALNTEEPILWQNITLGIVFSTLHNNWRRMQGEFVTMSVSLINTNTAQEIPVFRHPVSIVFILNFF